MNVIEEIEEIINLEVSESLSWYDGHARLSRITFRVLGTVTILLSVSIPLLLQANFDPVDDKLLISGLSLSMTFVTGITAFFKPDHAWKLNMGAKLNLESLYTVWQLEMLEAKSKSDMDESIEKGFAASHRFLKAAQNVTASNTEGFFANISFPDTK